MSILGEIVFRTGCQFGVPGAGGTYLPKNTQVRAPPAPGRPPTKIGKPVVRLTAPRSLETNRSKMATVSSRRLARSKKDYFVALRSALKRMGVLRRSRHTECKVELEIGNQ